MNILGISAFYHDSAVALITDGVPVAAAQEERFTRQKHDKSFPAQALDYCLNEAGMTVADLDYVVFYEKPLLTFERLVETYFAFAPRGIVSFAKSIPIWLSEKFYQKKNITDQLLERYPDFDWQEKILFAEHHQSHAASAFFPSPFEESLILTMDGVGEWATTTLAMGKGNDFEILEEIVFPHSLGLLYSAFTYFTGFRVNSGEYKVMGLAPYGRPKYRDLILEKLVDVKEDGSFRLNQKYFNYCTGLTMTNRAFDRLLGMKSRRPESPVTQVHMDLAASVQAVTEEIIIKLVTAAVEKYKVKNLCLAGGVALNCVANGKLVKRGIIDNLWVQPAAGDAGGALGAALAAYHQKLGSERNVNGSDAMKGAYLGPEFSNEEIEKRLTAMGATLTVLDDGEVLEKASAVLQNEQVVGWFQGRMEYGPRALGSRSILGDPRSPRMQKTLNLKIKYRESFRPFAPAVLAEDVGEWFDIDRSSPYMLLVADVLEKHRLAPEGADEAFGIDKLNQLRSSIPAVTHVDYSARVQTVHQETNPRFHALLSRFKQETGCPVLVNTSFNVRGEPIVCTPEDAFRCFMNTEMDVLMAGNCYMEKTAQSPELKERLRQDFQLD
jgi:carbamoyltransferase